MSGCAKSGPGAAAHGKHNVIVDPVTRIEGHLRVEAVVENGKIIDVRSSSQLFRGLEIILKGRDPVMPSTSPSVPAVSAPTCTHSLLLALLITLLALTRKCRITLPSSVTW